MPQLSNFLDRFRPAGAPGAAGRAGVPADRSAELDAELGPVLALLGDTRAHCARLLAAAHQEAARITAQAREQSERIAAEGIDRAEAARAAAAAQVLDSARARGAAEEQAARQRVQSLPVPSEADVQALILAAVQLVRSLPEEGGTR